MIAALLLQAVQADEAAYYAVDYLVPPEGTRVEVGGVDFLPDGRLICSTRRGQVWIVDNPLAKDPKDAQFHLFCEGLHEGLGLEVVNGDIYVLQRGELSKLIDEDKDGVCDRIDTVAQGWGYSGFYHEFAFGLPRDNAGNFYISLNVSFGDPQWWHGRSTVPDRGWILRIHPDGSLDRVACGARSPCGLGRNSAGDIFYTDNQGDWMPACPIFQVTDGAFFGHPASLNWTASYREAHRTASDTIPPERERVNAAIWLPYDWSRSTGNLVEDTTAGKFGPFAGQMFVAEMTNGYVLRAELQKVQGQYQGWCIPFRRKVGSNVRLRFASDGTLFCGFTDRGWGGQPPGDGIGRIRWTGKTPFDITSVQLIQQGFAIELTQPVSLGSAIGGAATTVEQYDYDYWWEYGSPLRHVTPRPVLSVALGSDPRKVLVQVPGLKPGMVARVKLGPLLSESGESLLHDEFAYTINQLPEGPKSTELVAKLVPPPEAKERSDEGIVRLMRGDMLDAWTGEGWRAGEVKLGDDATKLVSDDKGKADDWSGGAVSNAGASNPSDLVSKFEFGDIDFSFDFLLAKGSCSGLRVMNRYEIELRDSPLDEISPATCGAIDCARELDDWIGSPPLFNAYRGPGKWHSLSCMFQAPRFDASGKKIANAKFKRVMIDDTLLQEEIEVPISTARGAKGEVRFGPLVFQGSCGELAVRGVRVRSREPSDDAGWTPIFDGKSPDGWKGDAWKGEAWRVGEVKLDPKDPSNFAVDAEAKVDERLGPAISNTKPATGNSLERLTSREQFGDMGFHVDFMLSKGAKAQVLLMGHYAIALSDDAACGSVEAASFAEPKWPGRAPKVNAYRGAGKWHGLDVEFTRPDKTVYRPERHARFVRVMIDGMLLHDGIDVPYPTDSATDGMEYASAGPLEFDVEQGHAALRGFRTRSLTPGATGEGWTPIFDGKSLDGWKASDDGKWKVEDGEIVGSGPTSHLFSPRGDYKDFEVRAKCKISDGGNSGMYFRVAYGPGWPDGYEAQINSTHTDPVRTGSIYNLAPIKAQLVPPDTWFRYQVTCRDETNGTHITVRVNDVIVNDYLDKERKHASGHVAFQQHNDGSVVRIQDVEVRELH